MADRSKIEWTDATWTPIRARIKPDAVEIAKSGLRVCGYVRCRT